MLLKQRFEGKTSTQHTDWGGRKDSVTSASTLRNVMRRSKQNPKKEGNNKDQSETQ